MTAGTALAPPELGRVRWNGEGAVRSLSNSFTARWNTELLGRYVRHVLRVFAVPPRLTDGAPSQSPAGASAPPHRP